MPGGGSSQTVTSARPGPSGSGSSEEDWQPLQCSVFLPASHGGLWGGGIGRDPGRQVPRGLVLPCQRAPDGKAKAAREPWSLGTRTCSKGRQPSLCRLAPVSQNAPGLQGGSGHLERGAPGRLGAQGRGDLARGHSCQESALPDDSRDPHHQDFLKDPWPRTECVQEAGQPHARVQLPASERSSTEDVRTRAHSPHNPVCVYRM